MNRHTARLLSLALLVCSAAVADEERQDRDFKVQATYVAQSKRPFDAAYSGTNSLKTAREFSRSFTSTLYAGWRLGDGTELYFNPEIASGVPLSGLTGLGGFTNGEIARTSGPNPKLYRARLFLRRTWGFGGGEESIESEQNQLAGRTDRKRLVLTAGNLSALDVFDDNAYSHEPRRQFLNWSLMTHGAWDFPADARGYTWGGALEYIAPDWAARAGRFMQPRQSNGLPLNRDIIHSYGDVAEIERAHAVFGQPGRIRLLAFRNVAVMGNFQHAIDDAAPGGTPDLTLRRERSSKVGTGVNLEQSLGETAGVFLRASRHDGKTETFAFTEIDRSLSIGTVVKGALWGQARDEAGLGFVRNGLSRPHREYLARGGLGFFLGDGRLNYQPEQIVETYYSRRLSKPFWLSIDYQRIRNPGSNADRAGPVDVWSLRAHAEF